MRILGAGGPTWWESLDGLRAAREGVDAAVAALRGVAGAGELAEALADAGERIDAMAGGLARRIEARDARDERALEREYRRQLL
ncbi:MAG: hypothetical protein IJ124_08665 [Clostridia bacterium]|nr:hypothetical protein [Clostridia bacterium]